MKGGGGAGGIGWGIAEVEEAGEELCHQGVTAASHSTTVTRCQ